MWDVKFPGFCLVWEKNRFLIFFPTCHFRGASAAAKTFQFETFLMKIEWKKARPRKFTKVHESPRKPTKVHESSRKFTKVHESSWKSTKVHESCRFKFWTNLDETSCCTGKSQILFEFSGNELKSFVFIKFAFFPLISTQGITLDFLEGSELTNSEKRLSPRILPKTMREGQRRTDCQIWVYSVLYCSRCRQKLLTALHFSQSPGLFRCQLYSMDVLPVLLLLAVMAGTNFACMLIAFLATCLGVWTTINLHLSRASELMQGGKHNFGGKLPIYEARFCGRSGRPKQ